MNPKPELLPLGFVDPGPQMRLIKSGSSLLASAKACSCAWRATSAMETGRGARVNRRFLYRPLDRLFFWIEAMTIDAVLSEFAPVAV